MLLNFEVAVFGIFQDIRTNNFVTAVVWAAADADIDDRIKRKRIRVSLKK